MLEHFKHFNRENKIFIENFNMENVDFLSILSRIFFVSEDFAAGSAV